MEEALACPGEGGRCVSVITTSLTRDGFSHSSSTEPPPGRTEFQPQFPAGEARGDPGDESRSGLCRWYFCLLVAVALSVVVVRLSPSLSSPPAIPSVVSFAPASWLHSLHPRSIFRIVQPAAQVNGKLCTLIAL